ncbi:polyprenyl synthetase family protein [Listeria sp. PSOL-1]|uniref:polyprenyl synthetase family protein n=1 Tax=Listeria sp. PSOL-1 TaxID=1844999 RepID=UPI00351BACF0
MSQLDQFFTECKNKIDEALLMKVDRQIEPRLKEAMIYSLQAGGKRIRPLLLFATIKTLGGDLEQGLNTALALEMIHTYSLIHDDLPAMDNDDYRRGKLTNHKMYGDATAILAGDALLTLAFTILSEDQTISDAKKVALSKLISDSAGPLGMVSGQQADILAEGKDLTLLELQSIHHRKTGLLLFAAVTAGAIISDASKKEQQQLAIFADHIGVAFQICDDILDVTGDEEKLGKKTGADSALHKSTYPELLTLNGAQKALFKHYNQSIEALSELGREAPLLTELASWIVKRDN